jgi:hypothetical protein
LTASVQVIVPREIAVWERGFRYLAGEVAARGVPTWQAATEVFFEATQRYVHVITGQLKASGRMAVRAEGDQIVGEVAYEAHYAVYEFRRGGAHDALTRGWETAEATYRTAMGELWTEVVASWR